MRNGSGQGGLTIAELDTAINRCRSELQQFEEWRATHLSEAEELTRDIDEGNERLNELVQRRGLVVRRTNKAARRKSENRAAI